MDYIWQALMYCAGISYEKGILPAGLERVGEVAGLERSTFGEVFGAEMRETG